MSLRAAMLKTADATLGPLACSLFSRSQQTPEPRHADDVDGPILLIRPGGIGDAVMLLPALSALHDALPDRRIDILCETRNRPVFDLATPDAQILTYDTAPAKTLRRLRGNAYGTVIDTEQFHNFSGVMAAWTRAPLRIGFKINPRRRGLYTHWVSYDPDGPEDRQFMRLAQAALGAHPPLPPRLGIIPAGRLPVLPPDTVPDRPFLLVHAGGSTRNKCMPAQTLAQACRQAASKAGLAIVVTGARMDQHQAQALVGALGGGVINLCGRLSLTQTAALCRHAALLVGPDSGIAHLAVAVGTPAVVLFGPSDPAKWGPPDGAGEAVRIALPCSPCSIFGYTKPCTLPVCMTRLDPDTITSAILRVHGKEQQRS